MFAEALGFAQATNNQSGEATTLSHLGDAHLQTNPPNPQMALTHYEQALALHQATGDQPGQGRTLTGLGNTLLALGRGEDAIEALFQGAEIWESLRPGLTDANKIALFETQAATYAQLQQALLAQEEFETALEVAERGRARAFVELLANRLDGRAEDRLQTPEPPSIEQIRQIAQDQNATIVEYSLVGQELLIWVIQPNGIINLRRVDPAEVNLKNLEAASESVRRATETSRSGGEAPVMDWVQALREDLVGDHDAFNWTSRGGTQVSSNTSTNTSPTSGNPSVRRRPYFPLQRMYLVLIDPIADLLPQDPEQRIIFVPHRSLFVVPFPALQDPESRQFLVENHTVSTAPSIQVLAYTAQQKVQAQTQIKANAAALVVGNPIMPLIPPALGKSGIGLDPLPGAETEALQIAEILGTAAVTGAMATESLVIDRMSSASIIHLATHGLLSELQHLDIGVPGAIALAPEEPFRLGTAAADGLLTADEILNLDLAAQLVVLSACNTGRGNISGDGVQGLSRSFISAGVPSVLVSLWAVPDAPTAELMVTFYQQLQQTNNKAQALRQAMLQTMEQFPAPSNWAAFTLIGEAL